MSLPSLREVAAATSTLRMKVTTTFLRRVVVLVRALGDESDRYPLPPELRLAVLGAPDLDAYGAFRPEQDLGALRQRIEDGDLCFALLAGNRMVHATWASTDRGPLPYLDADASLDPGDVCLYDSYTAPDWRGRDLSRSRDEICRRHYRAADMRRTVALIARENAVGLRVTVPLGYRAIGEYGLLRLGPLRRRWCTTFGPDPVPRLVPRREART